MEKIEVRDFRLPATDGFELGASLYQRAGGAPGGAVVLIAPATGVKRRYYDRYARFLAESGFTTLTFDYRGIGDSRPRSLKSFAATIWDWAKKDLTGAIDWVTGRHRADRLLIVGHSMGGQLVGLVPNNDKIHAMLTVAAQSGYWGLWTGSRRWFMWFLWHALMPGLTGVFSYFPSKKLGLSEDLPGGVARQWAFWGRHRDYIVDERGVAIRDSFLAFRAPLRSYSFADDIHAPRAAVENLMQRYENAAKELIHLHPKDLRVNAIGHFGFFREQFRTSLWSESLVWLRRHAGDASRDRVPQTVVSKH